MAILLTDEQWSKIELKLDELVKSSQIREIGYARIEERMNAHHASKECHHTPPCDSLNRRITAMECLIGIGVVLIIATGGMVAWAIEFGGKVQ